uniref:C2 domain-containing protein n=1 Tax=Plectus sambesii TaxID=2011161 RepID=A0A914V146_9BILA
MRAVLAQLASRTPSMSPRSPRALMLPGGMNGQPPWMERGGGGSGPSSPTGIQSSQKQPLLATSEKDAGAVDDGSVSGAFWQKSTHVGSGSVSPAVAPRHNGHAFHFANPNAVDSLGIGDDGDDDFDRKSVMHYELGFYEKTHSSCFRGTLTFALRYDFIHRVLMVHVIRANHLPAKDRSGSSCDPYVKMYLLPERRNHCKTKINKKTLDPEFNEMFSFDVPFSSLAHRMLQFTVYDFDRFTRHDLTGNVIMRDLFEKSDLYSWTEYTMQIVGSNEKNDFGDLLLYLTYSNTEQKLIVTVAKAYNLRPMDITGASDPYVKVEQIYQRRRVKMRRTTTKRANLNPVYHETLEFDLPVDQIDRTNLLIQVMDWDRIGRDDLLGCCVLGAESPTPEGREQWRECFSMLGTTSQLYPTDRERSSNSHNNQLGVGDRRDAIDGGNSRKPRSIGKWHSILDEVPEDFRHITKAKK